MRTQFLSALSLIALAASACASPQKDVPAAKVAQEEEITGFRMAVLDICLASALAGKPVSDMATEEGPIMAETGSAALAEAKAGPGDSVWSPRNSERVLIKSKGLDCQVTTRGPLTLAALDSVEQALSDPHGFVPDPQAGSKPSSNHRRFSKKVGSQTFHVTLVGGDAPSSTLVATITSTPPA